MKGFPKITIIMRGYGLEEARCIVEAAKDFSKEIAFEVTMNTSNAPEIIRKLNKEFGKQQVIGAGTVLSFEQEIEAIDAGAQFILSACPFTKEMVEYAKARGVLTVPGVFTPDEALKMKKLGVDIIKIFPASIVGPSYFSAIQEPLDKLSLMAVGGISASNCHEYLTHGASYVGIGSKAFDPKNIKQQNYKKIREDIRNLVDSI
ncbi:bifunctional 4-hydroxy-2-oxoglutarate aldolase/2-dehydro-3-deoxy-phosphogluconate aldolase [Lactobacillus mulieris]|uniref:bifunctional 4-hydroxy-2-oxoglutarate aldolase/2-dehydro-3-deoxy-phosphogluconate aldolase n=1 Tax=Lactobacillus mulieris TaxID=2508708 RepID=UPI0001B2AEFC|nr:bifunctional 4-hydroxy-2-oxoglutarate aldolase/2-dehydro-3-deoxy-phosphogluconate aldolase [Lactobacillus mulieris]EEU21286.1 2-dehydro-3-deoxyphosphogluconate aldolase/4-hydroxy-2-oxoglutarate aldolase [Lactobacillus jensenii 27-2-CHN]EEX24161.1 KDPG and KHG aldolase [Lactobacillus jensenii 115-3-CHN]KAA9370800.1 bifunctional 4-hydroxy-2-oxoglutarate aldolase/2-dehydro-3-deoxy-phosphogluconate aldolase [Lactobacillus jensenii]MCW8073363.1 bifunctional 4-hydroxy-2-oxoglutarate aldolase/2-deh